MDEAYLERNAAFVAHMENAIAALEASGHFLTTQSLYGAVRDTVGCSYAAVAHFLKERGAAPQVDAYWDLRGRVGQWIAQHGLEREYDHVATWLTRLAGELRYAHDCAVENRLRALEAAVPHAPGAVPEPGAADEPQGRDPRITATGRTGL
jgi:hypothetical protein